MMRIFFCLSSSSILPYPWSKLFLPTAKRGLGGNFREASNVTFFMQRYANDPDMNDKSHA